MYWFCSVWTREVEEYSDRLLARDGDPETISFEETDTNFAIGWKGEYRIDGDAFVYIDKKSARVVATRHRISRLVRYRQ